MRIGIDIDGCLADFNSGFRDLIIAETGREIPEVSDTFPHCWNWPAAVGVTPEENARLWSIVRDGNSYFWSRLSALPGAANTLQYLTARAYAGDEVYFITSRPGQCAKRQTESWLIRNGYNIEPPTVLISDRKGFTARGLELDVFIDDKPENCLDVCDESRARVFLVDAPWNRRACLAPYDVPRVDSVMEAVLLAGGEIVEATR